MAYRASKGQSRLEAFIRFCSAPGERVFAIADAARDHELAFAARGRYGQQMVSLFEEPGASRLADVAPYVVSVQHGSEFLTAWENALGSSAGILVLSSVELPTLCAHLRSVFLVTDEMDEEFFFRFYDPRVLRSFLPSCTAEQAGEFFGPIRRILVESATQGRMLSCGLERGQLSMADRALADEVDQK